MARALAWGRRTVKARIYVSNKVTVTFDFTKIKPVNLSKSIAKAVKDSKVTLSGAEGEKNAAQIGSKTNLAVVKPDELDIKMKAFEHEKLRVKKIIDAFGTLQLGDVGPQIRSLQEILIEMGYLKSKSTAIY